MVLSQWFIYVENVRARRVRDGQADKQPKGETEGDSDRDGRQRDKEGKI